MAEYNEIMEITKTRIYLKKYHVNSITADGIYKFLVSIIDYANLCNYVYDDNEKSISIYINKDDNFKDLHEKYKYDVVLSIMTFISGVVKNDINIIDYYYILNKATCSAPHALALYDLIFLPGNDKFPNDILKIKF